MARSGAQKLVVIALNWGPYGDSHLTIGYKLRQVDCYPVRTDDERAITALQTQVNCGSGSVWWNDGGRSGTISCQCRRARNAPQLQPATEMLRPGTVDVRELRATQDSLNQTKPHRDWLDETDETGGVVNGEHEEEPHQGVPTRKE